MNDTPKTRIIKKYQNRRLYDTVDSRYVTLSELADSIRKGDSVEVSDAQTGKDITRSILTQIILEQETQDSAVVPVDVLRTIIAMGGDGIYKDIAPSFFDHFTKGVMAYQQGVNQMIFGGKQGAMPHSEGQQQYWKTLERWQNQVLGGFFPLPSSETASKEKDANASASGSPVSRETQTEDVRDSTKVVQATPGLVEELEALRQRLDSLERQAGTTVDDAE